MLDYFKFGTQSQDVSTGRLSDGGLPWVTFTQPTPRLSNGLVACGSRAYSALDTRWHRLVQTLSAAPKIGAALTLDIARGPASGVTLLWLSGGHGYYEVSQGPLALLLDPVQIILTIGLPLNHQGATRFSLPIPNDTRLAGMRAYLQGFSVDSIGLTASNALELALCR